MEIEIVLTKKNLVTYRTNVTLLPMEEFENSLSGDLQKSMYFKNIEEIMEFEKTNKYCDVFFQGDKITQEISKCPENVKAEYQTRSEAFNEEVKNQEDS